MRLVGKPPGGLPALSYVGGPNGTVIGWVPGPSATTDPAPATHSAASKATPVDDDEIPLADSGSAFSLKKLTWANLKSVIFNSPTITGPRLTGSIRGTSYGTNVLYLDGFASGVNYVQINNSVSGSAPTFYTVGPDGNIDFNFAPKGNGTVKVSGNPVGVRVSVPSSSSAVGSSGQWAADASYIYICTSTNTWKRAALSAW